MQNQNQRTTIHTPDGLSYSSESSSTSSLPTALLALGLTVAIGGILFWNSDANLVRRLKQENAELEAQRAKVEAQRAELERRNQCAQVVLNGGSCDD